MSDFQAIEEWAGALLAKLTPTERRGVARKAGQALRREQNQRIKRQEAPDGSKYAPRAKQPKRFREKAGGIRRRAMFAKLRTAKFMKVQASPDEIGVGFLGRAAQIAKVHQEGNTRRTRSGRRYVTPQRELLGLSPSDVDVIRTTLLNHLTPPS